MGNTIRAKHKNFKAGAQRSEIFPACRITEACNNQVKLLMFDFPEKFKSKADLLETAIGVLNHKFSLRPAVVKNNMLNYPHKQLELPVDNEITIPEFKKLIKKKRKKKTDPFTPPNQKPVIDAFFNKKRPN